ncbi:apoptosis facilitator Bcl-2-like protein 14 [Labrus bergylta]|uniref:apoptosis facilitator Bcl-2-like protein 14 n=1 Tax=Labrus bergylta TaxID=56723 RepID=UPI0033134EF8
METQTQKQKTNNNAQLIFVPHKDTIRLLEVYVKRSLSLNDRTLEDVKGARKEKWVTLPKKLRRHSSDPSFHLLELNNEESSGFSGVFDTPLDQPETSHNEPEKPNKKIKKRSFWKNVLSLISWKSMEEEEEDSPSEIPEASKDGETSDVTTQCLPMTPVTVQKRKVMKRKSLRRRFSKRRLSLTKYNKSGKDVNPAEITRVQDAIIVEPTNAYYEKFSEELEKIVHEVQENEEVKQLSNEELINRIIALTKQQGDRIDNKMKDNPTLSSFFQGMSYSLFQQLLDAYVKKEATPTHNPPTVLPTAPELVKLAFTLDFTARIAKISRQNVCHITGLGSRYLQDRFEYQQVCTDHPWSDTDD